MGENKASDSRIWSSQQTNQDATKSSPFETDAQIEERLAHIFKHLDQNGNGRIDIQELTIALKDFGLSHQYAEVGDTSGMWHFSGI